MISEREKLEFESLPEFIREPYPSARESLSMSSKSFGSEEKHWDKALPKAAELEALWPGVNHDFLQPSRRAPSFYLTVGFMAGAVVSLAGIWIYSLVAHGTGPGATAQKKIVVAGPHGGTSVSVKGQIASERGTGTQHPIVVDGVEVIVPVYSTYEVKTGDTLAGIALKAYRRVSPRLLDEICKANGMRNANVLSLGQKLILPEYRPASRQIAAGAGELQ